MENYLCMIELKSWRGQWVNPLQMDNMGYILQRSFSNAHFTRELPYSILIKISLQCVPMIPVDKKWALVQGNDLAMKKLYWLMNIRNGLRQLYYIGQMALMLFFF